MKIKFKLSVVKVVEEKKGKISRLVTKMINLFKNYKYSNFPMLGSLLRFTCGEIGK